MRKQWIECGVVVLLVATALNNTIRQAESGDLWIGFQNGRHMVDGEWAMVDAHRTWQMRALDRIGLHLTFRDPFSANARSYNADNWVDCGWINQNWLSHVILYRTRTLFGTGEGNLKRGEAIIVAYKFILVLSVAMLMYVCARLDRVHPILAVWMVVLAVLASRSFYDMRPNSTSFLFTASMMVVLGMWRRDSKRGTVLFWVLPMMLFWANMHGGFIYGLIVFTTLSVFETLALLIHKKWPSMESVSRTKLVVLFCVTGCLYILPAVFSPFGIRNLFHPILIGIGEEAKVFQQIAEWRPIWDKNGFGHTQWFQAFVIIFAFAWGGWCLLRFLLGCRWIRFRFVLSSTGNPECIPKFSLASCALVLVTLVMAYKSRRFIPLAAIVMTPYCARILQQSTTMILACGLLSGMKENLPGLKRRTIEFNVGLMTTLFGGIVLYQFVTNTSGLMERVRQKDELNNTLFRFMASAERHPAGAVWFLNANKIGGTAFNDWVDGGYVASGQTPEPETGEPRCKVFVDGRSQAVYEVEHYLYWRILNQIPSPSYLQDYVQVEQVARELGMKSTEMAFIDYLKRQYLREACPTKDPCEPETVLKRNWARLMVAALSHPETFEKLLEKERINVSILPNRWLADNTLFAQLGDWSLVFQDKKYSLYLNHADPQHRSFFAREEETLHYPDEVSRCLSVGMRYCRSDGEAARRQGVQLLMSIDEEIPRHYINDREYVPSIVDQVFENALEVDMHEDLFNYLLDRAKSRRAEKEELMTRRTYVRLIRIYERLTDLANIRWDYGRARKYARLVRNFRNDLQRSN